MELIKINTVKTVLIRKSLNSPIFEKFSIVWKQMVRLVGDCAERASFKAVTNRILHCVSSKIGRYPCENHVIVPVFVTSRETAFVR